MRFSFESNNNEFEQLKAEVIAANGKVDASTAARFMNNVLQDVPPRFEGPSSKDVSAALGNHKIGVEARLNLAEALINDPQNSRSSQELAKILNQSFGVNAALDDLARKQIEGYESDENKDLLDAEWASEFGTGSYRTVRDKYIAGQLDSKTTEDFLKFETKSFGKYLGIKRDVELAFYHAKPNQKGAYSPRTGKVNLNKNAPEYTHDPIATIGTLRHEVGHAFQDQLAEMYKRGKLDDAPGNTKILGHLYSVGAEAYITPAENHKAYENQTLEVDSNAIGKYSEEFLGKEEPDEYEQIFMMSSAKSLDDFIFGDEENPDAEVDIVFEKPVIVHKHKKLWPSYARVAVMAGIMLSALPLVNSAKKKAPMPVPNTEPVAVASAPEQARPVDTLAQAIFVSNFPVADTTEQTAPEITMPEVAAAVDNALPDSVAQETPALSAYQQNQNDIADCILSDPKLLHKIEKIERLQKAEKYRRALRQMTRLERRTGADHETIFTILATRAQNSGPEVL